MDDLADFSNIEKDTVSLIQNVRPISKYTGMIFGINKCAIFIMLRAQIVRGL